MVKSVLRIRASLRRQKQYCQHYGPAVDAHKITGTAAVYNCRSSGPSRFALQTIEDLEDSDLFGLVFLSTFR
jgi:hypothetical protein